MKKIYLYGNWKMNMNQEETEGFYKDFGQQVVSSPALLGVMGKSLETAVFPPFTSLAAAEGASKNIDKRAVPFLGAQNTYFEAKGAFTGEVSISMLKNLGCTHVIIGHSERRTIFGESDDLIAKKVKACLDAALVPVFCFGETLAEREGNKTFDVVSRQLRAALSGRSPGEAEKIVYAYEPVWAIGTGKSATSDEAQEVCAHSKKLIRDLTGSAEMPVVVLYGGSVKPDNAKELLSMDAIDGALVGGASLKADSFLQIYKAYAGIE
ncbi:MAG: triose-phosphate isomerase [Synergistaceae bacterium]|jgi:triosephosphate isomerase|nr:triose-phosphate isomerase [Synergistaceae bacterium]